MTTVRLERPDDPEEVRAIHAVHAASFPTEDEARLVDLLREAGRLAVLPGRRGRRSAGQGIVGHVGFSPVSLEGARAKGMGLAPVAVLPEHRRQGIAAALVREGLSACEDAGVGFVVVLGDPAYYGRFGFRTAADFGLRDEYGGGPAFQVRVFNEGALPAAGGLVRYAPEFGALEGA